VTLKINDDDEENILGKQESGGYIFLSWNFEYQAGQHYR